MLPFGGLALLVLAFIGGIYFEKSLSKTTTTASLNSARVGAGGSNGSNSQSYGSYGSYNSNRVFGQVTSISGQTFAVQDRNGNTDNVQVTSSTVFSDSASLSQLAVGDTVMVVGQSSSGVIQATRVAINPSFGGGSSSSTYPPPSAQAN